MCGNIKYNPVKLSEHTSDWCKVRPDIQIDKQKSNRKYTVSSLEFLLDEEEHGVLKQQP